MNIHEKNIIKLANQRLYKLLRYPACDEKTLSIRKKLWLSVLFGFFYIGFFVIDKSKLQSIACSTNPLQQLSPKYLGEFYCSGIYKSIKTNRYNRQIFYERA